jgi:hypothetical protein
MCDCPLTVTISNKVSERSLAIAGSQPQITTTHANLYTQLTRTKIDGECGVSKSIRYLSKISSRS